MANILLLVGSICFLLAIQTATTSSTISSSPDSSNSVTTDTTEATTGSTISSSPESSNSVITVTTEATTSSTISSSPDSSNSVTTDTTEATTGSTISSSSDSTNSVTTDTTEATTSSTISTTTGSTTTSSSDSTNSVTTDTTEATTGSTISTTTGSTISSSSDSTNSVTTDTTEVTTTTKTPTTAPHQCKTDSCKSHLANCVQLNDNYTCQCVFGYYYDVDKCLQGKSFSGTIIHQFDISKDDISSTNSGGYTEIYRNVTSAISSGFSGAYGYKETIVLKIRVNGKINMFSVRGGIAVSVDIVNIFSVDSNITKSEVEENVQQYLGKIGIQEYTSKDNCGYFNCNDATSTCKEGDVTPTCECKHGYYKVDLLDKSCMPSTDFKMITIIVGCVSAVIILGLTGGLIAVAIRRKDIEDNEDDDNDRILVAKKQSGTFGLQNPAMTNSHVTSPFTFPKVQAGSDWNQSSQVKRNGLNPGPPSYPQRGNVYNDDDEENDDVHISNNKGRIGNRGQTNPYNNPYSPGPMKPTQLPRTNGMKYGSAVDYGDDDDDGYHDIRGSSGVQMKPYNNRAPRATLDYSYPGSRKY